MSQDILSHNPEAEQNALIAEVVDSLNYDRSAIDATKRRFKEYGVAISKFNKGELEGQEREKFLQDVGTLSALRIACIVDQYQHYREYPPVSEEDRAQLETVRRKFMDFQTMSPGSSYIAGMENVEGTERAYLARERDGYARSARTALQEVQDYRLAPFLIEDDMLMQENMRLATQAARKFPPYRRGNDIAGAFAAVAFGPTNPNYLTAPIFPKFSPQPK